MKKLFFLVLLSLFFIPLFAQNKNLIFSEYYEYSQISNLNISLVNADLRAQKYSGDTLLVEIYSNNRDLMPQILNKENTFSITEPNEKLNEGYYTKVFLYFPVNMKFEEINIKNQNGDVDVSYVPDSKIVLIETSTGDIKINSSTCEYFSAKTVDGDMKVANLKCEFFIITSLNKSDIELTLTSLPVATSKIICLKGKIALSVKEKATKDEILEYIDIQAASGKIKIN